MTRLNQMCRTVSKTALYCMCVLALACGTTESTDDGSGNGGGAADTSVAADSTAVADGDEQDSGTTATDAGGADQTSEDGAATPDSTVEDAASGSDASTGEDASASDAGAADAAGGADTGEPAKKLPLPECAKSCDECAKCPDTPMCVNGQTFLNDCEAVCKLKAYNWPSGLTLSQGKCPECKACTTNAGPNAEDAFCAKTKGGVYVPVKQECELECLELATPVKCINGTCDGSATSCKQDWQCSPKSEIIKGSCGKFNLCSQPTNKGGAECPVNAYQPVCSKKDGKTYATSCAMQACDLSGCFAVGKQAKTPQCEPGKMEIACEGECYDTAKYQGKCPSDCAPVCAINNGSGAGPARTYRNGCIAKAEGAAELQCKGVAITTKDEKGNEDVGACSVSLYAGVNQGACCPDVDYSIVKQVCASKGQGGTAQWLTFRSQAEFECLTGNNKDWTFQYLGPCICNCTETFKPVCGKDGVTYQNACQAKCYGGEKLTVTDGTCNNP